MKLKVAVLFGGKSAEHEISLKSATNIFNAIDRSLFDPTLIGADKKGHWCYNKSYQEEQIDLISNDYFGNAEYVYMRNTGQATEVVDQMGNQVLNTFDIAFPIIHGTFGEDGTLQGFLKYLNIPFVGPDVLGSAVGMDKDVTKRLLRDANISIAAFYTLSKHDPDQYTFAEIVDSLKLPLFVKPANAGSSVGVSKVTNQEEFDAALAEAFKFDNKILIEEAIVGKEVECAVLGNEAVRASVIGEIVPTQNFYSYDAKYVSADGAKTKIPADISESVSDALRAEAIKAFQTICCEGLSRVDFFLKEDNTFVLNEINTLPGFTSISMYPKLWEQTGVSYSNLITELIQLGLNRQQRNAALSTEI